MGSARLDCETPEWLNMQCPICGKRFHLKQCRVGIGKAHYCSKECHRKAKMEYMRGEKNHQYGLRGSLNATWKGGRRTSGYGYQLVLCVGHPFGWKQSDYVFEHRLVAEKYLLTPENSVEIGGKRYLSPDYVVHHINGNRKDNRPENLRVMTLSDHQSMHAAELNKQMTRNALGQFVRKMPLGSTGK